MTDDLSIVWIVESGRSGARHQARVIDAHLDVDRLQAEPVDVPGDTSWDSAVLEGDGRWHPVRDLADAVRELDPDVTVFHVFSLETIKAAPEVSAFSPTILRVGLNPLEGAIGATGMNERTIDWYSSFDHLVCASEAARRKVLACGVHPSLTSVIPTALDFSEEAVSRPERDPPLTLGYLGRISPVKNPELPVFALYAHREIEPTMRTQLRFAGSGAERMLANVTGTASQLGLGINDVIIDGYVEDVQAWLDGIGINLHPSITENLPQSFLEAAQQGVPTIAADAAWTREFDSLVTVPADDPWAWGEEIAALLTNDARRFEVASEQQAEAAAKCHVDDVREQYLGLFAELVDETAGHKIDPGIKARGNL